MREVPSKKNGLKRVSDFATKKQAHKDINISLYAQGGNAFPVF
jgi:hypothetical protein